MVSRVSLVGATRRLVCLIALVAGAAAALSACGSSTSTTASSNTSNTGNSNISARASSVSGKHVNLAMFLVSTANTHQQAALKGAEQAVRQDGNASLHVYNGNFVPATQTNQIEDAIASGQYNGFIVDSIDGTQTGPAIMKALGTGIKVVCGFSICGPDQGKFSKQLPVTAEIAANYFTVGQAAGNAVVKGCAKKNPCNLVYLDGTPTLALDVIFKVGVQNVLKHARNVKIVASAEGEFLAGPSYTAMKTIIQAHPNINAVVSVGDQEIEGALEAINQSALKGKKVILVGDGASVIGTHGVASRKWYASAILRPNTEGYLAAKYAIAAVRGKPLSPDLVNSAIAPGFPSGYIDAANVAKWKPQWAG
jgi:ribose transport system substrate-binding protein